MTLLTSEVTIQRLIPLTHVIQLIITIHFDSEDDRHTGCRNVSHCQQQSYSVLRSPG